MSNGDTDNFTTRVDFLRNVSLQALLLFWHKAERWASKN